MRMLEAIRLLEEVQSLGLHVEAHGDRIRYAPALIATPEIQARLREHKDEILALLRGRRARPGLVVCPICPSREFWLPRRGNRWDCVTCSPPASEADVVARLRMEGDEIVLTFENLVDRTTTV